MLLTSLRLPINFANWWMQLWRKLVKSYKNVDGRVGDNLLPFTMVYLRSGVFSKSSNIRSMQCVTQGVK